MNVRIPNLLLLFASLLCVAVSLIYAWQEQYAPAMFLLVLAIYARVMLTRL